MNQEERYASDSDESDEDFCPEKEPAAGKSESEELSEEDEEDMVKDMQKKPTQKQSSGKTKKTKRMKKQTDDTDDDTDDEECEDYDNEDNVNAKRVTRNAEKKQDAKSKFDKDELNSDEDEKSRSDALWADFLGDTKNSTTKKSNTKTSKSETAIKNGTNEHKHDEKVQQVIQSEQSHAKTEEKPKQMTITEIVDFAGEEVRVQKTVNIDSIKENNTSAASVGTTKHTLPVGLKRAASGSSTGLGSILNQIGKKKKISVLEKSKLDWNSFKQDEGIDEQLQTFNKGKDGYLERQDFLQRTDVRQFEIEKNLRQSQRH